MRTSFILISVFFSLTAYATPTKTFYVKVLGDSELGTHLLAKLGKKKCHVFGDKCHAFKSFENNAQINGDFSKDGSSVLYQVNITKRDKAGRFNLQIFQRDGKSLRRVRNAGNFTPQKFKKYENRTITDEEFFNHLVDTTIRISFK